MDTCPWCHSYQQESVPGEQRASPPIPTCDLLSGEGPSLLHHGQSLTGAPGEGVQEEKGRTCRLKNLIIQECDLQEKPVLLCIIIPIEVLTCSEGNKKRKKRAKWALIFTQLIYVGQN